MSVNDWLLAGLAVFIIIGIMEVLGRTYGDRRPKWTENHITRVFCMRMGITHRVIYNGMSAPQAVYWDYVDSRYFHLSQWEAMRMMKGGCVPFPPVHSTLTHS